jgi:hypothetical protein
MVLLVLLNICHYPNLAALVAAEHNSTDALLDLMQMFRDKKSIFTLATELMSMLVKSNVKTKVKNRRLLHFIVKRMLTPHFSTGIMQPACLQKALRRHQPYRREKTSLGKQDP